MSITQVNTQTQVLPSLPLSSQAQGTALAAKPQAETAAAGTASITGDSVLVSVGKHSAKSGAGLLAGAATSYVTLLSPLTPMIHRGFDGLLLGGGAAIGGTLAGTIAGNLSDSKTTAALSGALTGAVVGGALVGYKTKALPAALAGAALGAISGAVSGLTSAAVYSKH